MSRLWLPGDYPAIKPLFRWKHDHAPLPGEVFARNGSATYLDAGVLKTRPAEVRRSQVVQTPVGPVAGALLEPTGTNRARVTVGASLTGWTGPVDGSRVSVVGATFDVVNDAAALAAAGLSAMVPDGLVYRLQNPTAENVCLVLREDSRAATNGSQFAGAYVRGGLGGFRWQAPGTGGANFGAWGVSLPTYERRGGSATVGGATGDNLRRFCLRAFAGETIYFILQQIEEDTKPFATSIIPNSTTSNLARATDVLTYAYAGLPQVAGETWYIETVDLGAFQSESRNKILLLVGGSGTSISPDNGILIWVDSSNNLNATVRAGASAFTSSVALSTLGAEINDRVRLSARIYPDGASHRVALGYQRNGGAITEASPSSTFTLPAAWSNPLVAVGSAGDGTRGTHALHSGILAMPQPVAFAQMAHWNEVLP